MKGNAPVRNQVVKERIVWAKKKNMHGRQAPKALTGHAVDLKDYEMYTSVEQAWDSLDFFSLAMRKYSNGDKLNPDKAPTPDSSHCSSDQIPGNHIRGSLYTAGRFLADTDPTDLTQRTPCRACWNAGFLHCR